ncbi:hypothetical protein P4131_22895 [Pseudomonas aeruginosa]|nr:hypothetical protein [Pseudomonas aeruginosa]
MFKVAQAFVQGGGGGEGGRQGQDEQENAVGHGVSGVGGDALEPGTASPHDEESKRPFKAIACWRWDALALVWHFVKRFTPCPSGALAG